MIVNKYQNGGGSGSGGTIDSGAVKTIVDNEIDNFSQQLQEGEPIVGMAKQLYSPDGVTSEGAFAYRTTAGDADVSSGPAELKKIEGNSIYPELQYDDSAALERSGEPVTGFTYVIEWGDLTEWITVEGSDSFSAKKVRIKDPSGYPGVWLSNGSYYQLARDGNDYMTWNNMSDISGDGTRFSMDGGLGEAYVDEDYIVFEVYNDNVWVAVSLCDANAGQGAAIYQTNTIPNDIPAGESTYVFAIDENNVLGAWTPSLPQALHNMKLDDEDYEPEDGDEIVINRVITKPQAIVPNPTKFVAVGLNLFNKDANTPISSFEYDEENDEYKVVVRAVEGVEYTVYNPSGTTTIDGAWAQPSKNVVVGAWSTDGDYKVFTPAGDPNIVNEGSGEGDHSSVFAEFDYYDGEAEQHATLFQEWNVNWEVEEDERYGWWSVQIGDPDGEYEYVMSLEPNGEESYQFDANADGDKFNLVWDGTTLKFYKTDSNDDVYPMTMDMHTPVLTLEPHNETGDGVHIEIENGYPYILIITTNKDTLCVHPMWSGYMDEVYEPYEENYLNLPSFSACPLYSVGDTRNVWDFENGIVIKNIGTTAYTAAAVSGLIASGKVEGVDFEYDDNLIYYVLDVPEETIITFDGKYTANDFGVEYFLDADGIIPTPLYATTYYMNNLVDKLRRMEGLVHLNSMSGTGSENTLYECDEQLYMWSDEGGTVAEWSNLPARSANDVRSFALSFDYIPDGTELFRVRYFSSTYYTKLVYSGNALYTFTEEDGYATGTYLCSMNDSGATLVVGTTSGVYPKLKISKHNITFYQLNSSGFGLFHWEGFWNCIATGAHWVRADRPAPKLYLGDGTHSGLLTANDAGLIVGWPEYQPIRRTNKINNSYVNVYAGSNVPNIWVPTDGGTEGQMLISNGTSAPTWSNWIKSVQITSDAYEALATKDPNTLYIIVDE